MQPGHEAHHEGIKREHARNYGQGVGAKSLLHFGVGFCKFYVNLGKAELNFSKSVIHVGTYVGELEFHLGLGEDGSRSDVAFRFWMQVKCDRDTVCTGNKSGWTKSTFA